MGVLDLSLETSHQLGLEGRRVSALKVHDHMGLCQVWSLPSLPIGSPTASGFPHALWSGAA